MTNRLASTPYRAARRRVGNLVLLSCGIVAGVTFLGLVSALVWVVGHGLADLGGTLGRRDELSDTLTGALSGSLVIAGIASIGSVLIGVGAAVYVSEVVPQPRLVKLFFTAAQSVAALPSVVFGIVGMALVVQGGGHALGLLSAAVTLSFLAIPRVVLTTRDALLQVPASMRSAAYALGATRLQTVRDHILPVAIRGIAGGILSTMARTFGATAPLVMLGFVLHGDDAWQTLPVVVVDALASPSRADTELAGAAVAIVVLMHVGLTLWSTRLQQRFERTRWL